MRIVKKRKPYRGGDHSFSLFSFGGENHVRYGDIGRSLSPVIFPAMCSCPFRRASTLATVVSVEQLSLDYQAAIQHHIPKSLKVSPRFLRKARAKTLADLFPQCPPSRRLLLQHPPLHRLRQILPLRRQPPRRHRHPASPRRRLRRCSFPSSGPENRYREAAVQQETHAYRGSGPAAGADDELAHVEVCGVGSGGVHAVVG